MLNFKNLMRNKNMKLKDIQIGKKYLKTLFSDRIISVQNTTGSAKKILQQINKFNKASRKQDKCSKK